MDDETAKREADKQKVLSVRIAVGAARGVLRFVPDQDRQAARAAIEAAEAWCEGRATEQDCANAAAHNAAAARATAKTARATAQTATYTGAAAAAAATYAAHAVISDAARAAQAAVHAAYIAADPAALAADLAAAHLTE